MRMLRLSLAARRSSPLLVRSFVNAPQRPEPIRVRLPEDEEMMTTLVRSIPKWFKNEGDAVAAGEALCEVDTGEVVFDLQSPVSGYIVKITAQEGSKNLRSGEIVAYLAGAREQITSVAYEAAKEIALNKVTVHLSKEAEAAAAAAQPQQQNMSLAAWLDSLGAGEDVLSSEYLDVLKSEGFTSVESMKSLDEEDLNEMKITKRAHRKMILAGVQALKN